MPDGKIFEMVHDLKTGKVGAEKVSDLKYVEPIFWEQYGLKMIQKNRLLEAIKAVSN